MGHQVRSEFKSAHVTYSFVDDNFDAFSHVSIMAIIISLSDPATNPVPP